MGEIVTIYDTCTGKSIVLKEIYLFQINETYSSTMYNNECTCIYKNKITIHCKHFVTLIHVLFS